MGEHDGKLEINLDESLDILQGTCDERFANSYPVNTLETRSAASGVVLLNTNLLLTEPKGRTGKHWPEVVAAKNDRGPIFLNTEQVRLVSCL